MAHAKALVVLVVALLLASRAAGRPLTGSAPTRRQLLSSARATSLSNGSADIDTSAVAVKGGSAVAEQAASQGKHSKVALAVGNTTTTAEQHSPVPDDPAASAPACPFAPTSLNSVKDRSGRLWGWHRGSSCMFKDDRRPAAPRDMWDAAPPCPAGTPRDSTVLDKSRRTWGWANGTSCTFKDTPALGGSQDKGAAPRDMWASAPACPAGTPTDKAVMDRSGRKWGWAGNTSCAFKDANGGRALLAELGSGAALSDLPHVTPVSATSVPVLLVNSVNKQPEGEALPASDSVVTTTYGTGADAVDCALVNVPDPATNVTRSQLNCQKANPSAAVQPTTGTASVTTVPLVERQAVTSPPAAEPAAPPPSPVTTPAPASPATPPPAIYSTAPLGNTPATPASTLPAAHGSASPSDSHNSDLREPGTAQQTVAHAFGATWEAAPACVQYPTQLTAVQDTLGRLWWTEQGRSCAYRDSHGASIFFAGYTQVKWETTGTCTNTPPTLVTSMADAEGRLWWFESGANCAYRHKDGSAFTQQQLQAAVSQ